MDILTSIETVMDSDLLHYGRKGMKWGVRNGPPYPLHPEQLSSAEKKARRSVFISGSSKTQSEDSGYYRKELPKAIQNKIDDYIKDHAHIIVGDAPGIDRQVQDYLNKKGYDAVEIYGPGKQVRYAANDKWKTNPVDAPEFEEMSPEWLRKKDIAMTNDATEGLAIVLDDGAQATRNNVARLREQGKQAEVFILNQTGDDDWEANPGSYEQMHKYLDRIEFPDAYNYLFDSYGKLTSAGRKALEHYFEKIPNEHEHSGLNYAFENGGITKVKDGYELQENGHIRRVANENEPLDSRRKYASVTRNDAILYDQWNRAGELDTSTDTPSYTYEYSTKPKFKIADEAAVVSYVADAYGGSDSKYNAEIYNKYLTGRLSPKEYSTGDDTYQDALFGHALSIVSDVQQEFKRANGIRGRSDAVNKGKTSLYKHFSKLGYDAVVDVEDYMREAELPIIVLNPKESLTIEKTGRWTDYSLFDAYDEYKNSLSHSDFFAEFVQAEDLEQHGIKGQKWGHRNGPPYPLDQETHEKVTKGEDTGVYKKGSKFYRVSTKEREDLSTTDYKYVTTLKKDRDVYRGPMATDWMYDESESVEDYTKHTIQEIYDNFTKRGFHMYELTFEASKDLKSPSKSERQRMLKELVNEDPTVIDRAYDFFKHDKLTMKDKEKLDSIGWAFDKKRWTKANGTLGDLAYDPDAFYYFSEALNEAGDIRRQYFDKVKSSGYNMIVDDHDAGILSERPFIVIDPIETLTQVYAEELNGKSIEKSYRRWERAQDWYTEDEKSFVGHSDFFAAVELVVPDDALQYGVLGQQWGVRHWQNKDGTLTPAGRERWINSLKQEAYAASKKWEEYQKVRKQVIDMHHNSQFDNELETKMRRLKDEADEAGAIWGSLRKRIESYLENGPDVSTSEPAEDAPHKVLIPVADEAKYKHFKDLGYVERGRNDTWIYMVSHKKNIRHSDDQNDDVLAAVETVMDGDIEHHGRKGMKWGVRNGPPYPLGKEQLSARERMLDSSGKKNIAATGERKKWQKSEALSALAMAPYTGLFDDKLTKKGRKHMAEMLSGKELKAWGKATEQAKANSLKKAGIEKSEQGGHTMKVGSKLYRIADATDQIDDKRKYVSATENDLKRYNETFNKGFLALHKRDTATEFQYKGQKDIRVADADDVLGYVVDKYGGKREKQLLEDVRRAYQFRDALKELNITGLGTAADIAVANYLSNTAPMELRSFVKSQLWDGSTSKGKKAYADNKQSAILGHYRDLGYDAIVDVEDYLSGFEYPMIMIDPKKSISVNKKRALDPDMEDPERRARLTEAGVKRQNKNEDTIAKGSTFTRQASVDDDKYHDRKYMSITKKDTDYYRKEFGNDAEYSYVAKRKLKVASAQAVVDYIVKDMDNYGDSEEGKKLSEMYSKYRGDTESHLFQFRANKERDRFDKEVVDKQRLMYGRDKTEDTHRQILDHFSQLGYDAIVDINQSWQGMDYPVIIIDPDDSTKLKTKITRRVFKR